MVLDGSPCTGTGSTSSALLSSSGSNLDSRSQQLLASTRNRVRFQIVV